MRILASMSECLHARRLIGLLALAAFLAAHVPIPVTAPALSKDHDSRYPCENHPCGCQSAEQCWRSCCCFSNAEKLAWARENGVTPPDFVIAAAEKESAESTDICCTRGCCESHDEQRDDGNGRTRFIIGVVAQRCQGLSSHWLGLPWMVPAAADVPRSAPELNVPLTCVVLNEPTECADRPPTPPPRVEAPTFLS